MEVRAADVTDLRKRIKPDQVARKGAGWRCVARRAARDDAEGRALLGDGLRLAKMRGEAERADSSSAIGEPGDLREEEGPVGPRHEAPPLDSATTERRESPACPEIANRADNSLLALVGYQMQAVRTEAVGS
jgi:hypothetical protein